MRSTRDLWRPHRIFRIWKYTTAMDTPPNSMGNDVSNRAMMLQGHRLKGPPTLSSMDYPEKQNLENDALREDDRSTHRPTIELARRK